MSIEKNNLNQSFGSLLGYAPGGVAIYSSDYHTLDPNKYPDNASLRGYLGHEYMGYKWQCVEFARRFLYINYGMVFTDVDKAYQIFELRFLRQVINDAILPLQAFANGSQRAPAIGALLIWSDCGEFEETGHVAIISEILDDKIRIVEQNVIHSLLPFGQQWTRELPLFVTEEGYLIQDSFHDTHILGWMIQTNDTQYSLAYPTIPAELLMIQRCYLPNQGQFAGQWLNDADPLEHAYILANGHHIQKENPYRYSVISHSAHQELIRATNELHLMYLHATDQVLKSDQLLHHFNIPEVLWPRIRLSWSQRRYQTISGRMDFCMDERGLKIYEYNADSASCHTETGLILAKWATQGGLKLGSDPGKKLLDRLSESWRHSDADSFVHIMQDHDQEENYHALFMQRALEQAGFQTKILHGLTELHWDNLGRLVDDNERRVKSVWKTWAWETALDQLREEVEEQSIPLPVRTGHHADKVRLIDVLLRPEVKVFEPLWTVIPSNKAILPVLWSLFPQHRYLLEAHFELTPSLIQQGYAAKPIAGRCGFNIELVNHQAITLDKTAGRFAAQDNIYQQLWCLPNIADSYLQLCTFTAGGHYGATSIRSDSSLVIKGASDIEPLRILQDKMWYQ